MKKIIVLITILVVVLSAIGCNAVANDDVSNTDNQTNAIIIKDEVTSPTDCMMVEKIPFTLLAVNNLPESIVDQVDFNRIEASQQFIKNEDGTFIVIYMGEKNTGGYEITVEGIFDLEDRYGINVLETKPAADAMVTMALTYPLVIIKVESEDLSEENISVNRYTSSTDEIINTVELPIDEVLYVSPVDHYEEGDLITIGEIIEFRGDTIHIMSGDIIEVYRSELDQFNDFYLGETVQLIKAGETFKIKSYLKDDFSMNHTNMGHIIVSVTGTVTMVRGDIFEVTTEEGIVELEGAKRYYLEEGETVTVEYVDFQGDQPYAIEVLRPSEVYDLKILAIDRLENGMMEIKATKDMKSEEVSYIVRIDSTTVIRLNLSDLSVGNTFRAYAEVILESYPMQMMPKRIVK